MNDVPSKGITRYAAVLGAVSMHRNGLSLSEIARETGLPKGTVHRTIRALISVGYLSEGSGHASYHIGPKLLRILHSGLDPEPINHLVQPTLETLVETFKETAYLTKLVGVESLPIAVLVPKGLSQAIMHPGRLMPPHAAASAKAIAAFQEPELLDKILEQPMVKYTQDTLTTLRDVRDHLARVRDCGYAECINEIDEGVMAIAVPVRLDDVGVIYSVAICGLQARLDRLARRTIVDALSLAAKQIAAVLRNANRT